MKVFRVILYVLSVSLLFPQYVYSQQVTKVLVSGYGGTYASHDQSVEQSFRDGYASYDGSVFPGTISQYIDKSAYLTSSFDYADKNGYQVIVRSYKGVTSAGTTAQSYPNIKAFLPAGSNSYVNVYTGSIESNKVIVTGAGDDSCETGYSVEFFAPDPVTIEPDYSSFSNGYIAGQICYLANKMNCTVEQARMIARAHASQNGELDLHNGYGRININTVLSSSMLPVELASFSAAMLSGKVNLKWQTKTEINNYGFEIEKSISPVSASSWNKVGFVQGKGNSSSESEYTFTDNTSPMVTTYYRLKQIDFNGAYEYSGTVELSVKTPSAFELMQNYPNPFNPSTTISYSLPEDAFVKLNVYDITGRQLCVLVNEKQQAGVHSLQLDAENSGIRNASGVYLYQLITAGSSSGEKYSAVRKMVLLK